MDKSILSKIFKSSPVPTAIIKVDNHEYTYFMINDAFLKMLQREKQNLIGESLFEKFPENPDEIKPTVVEKLTKSFQKVIATKETDELNKLRYDIRQTDGTYKKEYWKVINSPVLDDDGDVEFIINTLNNITDQVYNKIRFQSLIEQGNDVLIILNSDGTAKYVSPSIKKVLGYSVKEALQFDISNIVHPNDQELVASEIQKSFEKPGVTLEVPPARMRHKNGEWRWFAGSIKNMFHDPDIAGIVDNFRDITDQINAQNKLKETKELYQSLIQTIDGVVWEAQADTFNFTYVSPQSKDMFGYEPQTWTENTGFWESCIHPDDRIDAVKYCQAETSKGLNHDFEYRFRKASGEYIWIHDIVTVIHLDGKPDLLRGLMIDITEKKKLVSLMEETYEIAKIGNWELNLRTEQLYWSPYIKKLHEVSADYKPTLDEAINFYLQDGSRETITKKVEKAINENIPFDTELKIKTDKGNIKWVRVVGTPEMVNEECIRLFGSSQDITEQKLMQEGLKSAEERHRNVVEHSTNMFYSHDAEGILHYVSPQSIHFLGLGPEEAKKRWVEFITDHPVNELGVQITQRAIETGMRQEPYELQLRTDKGNIIWVEVNEAPIVENGETVSIVGSLTDITRRKKYEGDLKESLERYNYVSKATRDAIFDHDLLNNKIHWGDGFYNIFGYSKNEDDDTYKNWKQLVHPDDLKEIKSELNTTYKNPNINNWSKEYRFLKGDGNYAYISENGYIIRDDDGKAVRMIGAIQDISSEVQNKKELEASLTEKETLLSEIHHRVKNNLAVVSGMMQLQAYESDDLSLQDKLYDSVARIKTMATVHELLYQSQSFSQLEFSETLEKLVESISDTLQVSTNIETNINCDPVKLNINQAIPASLIVNEVVTNVYKHAFKNQDSGTIKFDLFEVDDHVNIIIEDDGIGFENDINKESKSSLGLHLIKLLSEQILATYTYKNKEDGPGAIFKIEFQRSVVQSGIGSAAIK